MCWILIHPPIVIVIRLQPLLFLPEKTTRLIEKEHNQQWVANPTWILHPWLWLYTHFTHNFFVGHPGTLSFPQHPASMSVKRCHFSPYHLFLLAAFQAHPLLVCECMVSPSVYRHSSVSSFSSASRLLTCCMEYVYVITLPGGMLLVYKHETRGP